MPLRILELGKMFRPATSVVYPPFKNGRYMEEYFYDYVQLHKDEIDSERVYIPVFWTNLQIHPGFISQKHKYETLLSKELAKLPKDTKYFTVVQHDDGIMLNISADILIFGGCNGNIPLPLIYEDITQKLINTPRNTSKTHLASFVGTITHSIRGKMQDALKDKSDISLGVQRVWTSNVSQNAADTFITETQNAKFCLAPRGYGRSSFRFFEAMLLDVVPVYFWNDIEWLPYKDTLDYSKFAVVIHEKDIDKTYDILKSISDEKYQSMLEEIKNVRYYFTLEGMSDYIFKYIKS